ncbi:MAG TPA: hypothetical protein ENJ20_06905 [Bacteroidetes bacterium]|nr:hypothetical protein [Bacteroidota bacterium]
MQKILFNLFDNGFLPEQVSKLTKIDPKKVNALYKNGTHKKMEANRPTIPNHNKRNHRDKKAVFIGMRAAFFI